VPSKSKRKEQTDDLMKQWNEWMSTHKDAVVDAGLPLGKTKRVTAEGVTDAKNDLNWYLIVQAESQEAAAEMFVTHPHLVMIPSAYAEVMGTEGMSGA
jgi:hypothetical protein